MAALAQQRGGLEAAGAQQDSRIAQALRQLETPSDSAGASARAERSFLVTELQVHPVLVEMYQAQASQSTDRELARVAIGALVGIQEDFATAIRLGATMGLAAPEPMIANPPQYGTTGSTR
jgi:hypothetical protein